MQRRFRVSLTARLFKACAASVALCSAACAQTPAAPERFYDVEFRIALEPGDPVARVTIAIAQDAPLARELKLRHDAARHRAFAGDGGIDVGPERVTWTVPPDGGELSYEVSIPDAKPSGSYTAYVASDWALFRAFDVIPSIATRTAAGARSRSRMTFDLDEGASVTTAYAPSRDGGFVVDLPDRRFSRPAGWIVVGDIGERIDSIGSVRLVVAGPKNNGVRRLDILAFLRWNLPAVVSVFPDYPSRLLIVSADDPLWRGGLSGPASVYLHADRPLISENGTSTLLHELVHVACGWRAAPGDDWIVEGVAEYYAIEHGDKQRRGPFSTADNHDAA
ncbi:MAG: hypothetical protein AAGD86_11350 [Pseudomonadota bacterium]